tara:strand:+ start:297 stop:818 length:522 start_codon:yes stop_codon:yes gene_type:complete
MIYLNIGTNLESTFGNKFQTINQTIKYLTLEHVSIVKVSNFFETPSYPDKDNPKFINISLEVNFDSKPIILMEKISIIEKKMGRIKKIINEPRVCDIDIIDFMGIKVKSPKLILPHPRAHIRNFVLLPLKEICPNWIHPVFNKKIDNLISNLSLKSRNEITRLKESAIIRNDQ